MKNKTKLINTLYLVICPIITFYLLEFYTHNPFTTMKFPIQILNMVFFELVALLFWFLFGRIRIALMAETSIFLLVGLANYFVLQFRSAPIMPWDIFSLSTAASVAGNYSYKLSPQVISVLIGFFILLILEWFCKSPVRPSKKKRVLFSVVAVFLIWGYGLMLHQDSTVLKFRLYDKLFTPTVMTKRNGTAVAFIMELEYLFVSKPNGYSKQEASDLLASYKTDKEVVNTPNIIVIMDEAFSDLNVFGDFALNEDYIPFTRNLLNGAENTVSGYTHVSILGGNTPNTEFEFLTGNTLAFLPQGSIPFQQYIKQDVPSMASFLKNLGYQTIGMHPYYSSGWDRDTVYPLLGFDTAYFLDDFKPAEYVRKYVSDKSSFDKIIDLYTKKDSGQPLFLFNVTMQNHSAYTEEFDNFTPTIKPKDTDSEALSNYLSLLKLTDDALADLIRYFEEQEEDTIIVFFGDHQPTNSVVEPVLKLNGMSSSSLTDEEEALRYKIPFFIWANYDIEEASGVEISANYLGTETLRLANLPLSPYFNYLKEMKDKFPIVSAIQSVDSFGKSTAVKDRQEELLTYSKLQYYQLFDFQNN